MQKYELDSFELSQAHLFFWDKLEKANWFLEQILSTLNEPLEGRLMQRLLGEPLSDGGQWDMVHNLVEKYGLVPQALYPDSFSARSSSVLNSLIFTKLREFALKLRWLAAEKSSCGSIEETVAYMETVKADMVRQIHSILVTTLGPPPAVDAEFTWEFVDRTGRARRVRTTPKAFARDIYTPKFGVTASDVAGMVSLVDDPRNPAMFPLEVERLGNVVGGRGVRYTNVDMATLKRACVAQLRAGIPVFFGCDVGKFSGRDSGVMDTALIDYTLGFGPAAGDMHAMSKQERLQAGESAMTHAMVLTAVHVDEKTGETVRWRVQNSWGEDAGSAGWFVMTDRWMDEFVYQAVIDSRFLSKQVRDVAKGNAIVLPLWDPMGSLA
jgi:bleomycin hydrolase